MQISINLGYHSAFIKAKKNSLLTRVFSSKEIDVDLSHMHPLKALGPDSYGVSFFHKPWGTVGEEVKLAVLDFLNHGNLDPLINFTYIALISNKFYALSICDYRCISLFNVLYKLIAKVQANRLKMVLPSIISQH